MKNTFSHLVAALVALLLLLVVIGAIVSLAAYFSGNRTDGVRLLMAICVLLTFLGGVVYWKSRKVREWFAIWIVPIP